MGSGNLLAIEHLIFYLFLSCMYMNFGKSGYPIHDCLSSCLFDTVIMHFLFDYSM